MVKINKILGFLYSNVFFSPLKPKMNQGCYYNAVTNEKIKCKH